MSDLSSGESRQFTMSTLPLLAHFPRKMMLTRLCLCLPDFTLTLYLSSLALPTRFSFLSPFEPFSPSYLLLLLKYSYVILTFLFFHKFNKGKDCESIQGRESWGEGRYMINFPSPEHRPLLPDASLVWPSIAA